MINRRFTNYYITRCDLEIENFNFSEFEIDEPKWIDFDIVYDYVKSNEVYKIKFENENFEEMFKKVEKFLKSTKEN